ncbi:MAG: hypothetical protein N2Z70_03755 [Bdellovibrionaceae bacterium]|jgi:hypothetical protein|nr:hypothetical protein [Pseudobdellovibrionaceae bacterium]
MGLSKHKRHIEHENHERWLVSYADFITLLFAFFVVLYATSEANQEKQKQFQESLKEHLRGLAFVGAPLRLSGGGADSRVGPQGATSSTGNRVIPPIGLPLTSRADRAEVWEITEQWLEQARRQNAALAQAWSIQEGSGEGEILLVWSLDSELANIFSGADSAQATKRIGSESRQAFWQGVASVMVLVKKLDCPVVLSWRGGRVSEEQVTQFLLGLRKKLLSLDGVKNSIFIQLNPAQLQESAGSRLVFALCGREGG